jgi:hypothetical protein
MELEASSHEKILVLEPSSTNFEALFFSTFLLEIKKIICANLKVPT